MMTPDTRPSLLMRVKNPRDREAWEEFVQIYQPVIIRMGRYRGMQAADTEDLAQQVLLAVAGAIERWEPGEDRAKFRTWLRRITTNAILNALTRGIPDIGTGNADIQSLLEQQPDENEADSQLLATEYRREVFQWAARLIRPEFSDDTWNAFRVTAVEGMDAESAAKHLGRSRGSIYASRSRIMKRLKEKVSEYVDDDT
ncbi:MAG: sigma-70 family RNA polymerase sigma factor [Planctomycetaceae bacterium]|nr:sigma-70 family RNA polymerase sigma factor [Planctomycetaceae bacterium]